MLAYAESITKEMRLAPLSLLQRVDGSPRVEDFAIGEVRFAIPHEVRAVIDGASKTAPLTYVDPQGLITLRQAYATHLNEKYQLQLTADNVLVTAGGREACWLSLMQALMPNDVGLIPIPAWPAYREWFGAFGVSTSYYDPIDPSLAFASLDRSRSLLLLNYPHNPTGVEPSQTVSLVLLDLASAGFRIVSDDVYRCYSRDPSLNVNLLRLVCDGACNITMVDSLSKATGCAGLRIGFAVANPSVIKHLTHIRASIASCVTPIAQVAATLLLTNSMCAQWLSDLAIHCAYTNATIAKQLTMNGWQVVSNGAIYVWLRSPKATGNPVNCVQVRDVTVRLAPGDLFGASGHLRVCTARPANLLELLTEMRPPSH